MNRSACHFTVAIVVMASSVAAGAATITGNVVRVISGDAFEVKPEAPNAAKPPPAIRVSIAAIDSPDDGQPFDRASKDHLASLINGKSVSIDTKKNDTKGAAIGKVVINGTDIGLQMVRAGFAWYAHGQAGTLSLEDQGYYLSAEGSARRDGAGLWADRNPTAPWVFRRMKGRPTK